MERLKLFLFVILVTLCAGTLSYATENQRYEYYPEDKLVFDSLTGNVIRFINQEGTVKHVVVEYPTGIVKVDGAIRARGTFDYRDAEDYVIISET